MSRKRNFKGIIQLQSNDWGSLVPLHKNYKPFQFDDIVFNKIYQFGISNSGDYVFDESDFDEKEIYSMLSSVQFKIFSVTDECNQCGFITCIEDCSEHGTYLNKDLIGKGKTMPLVNYAIISLTDPDKEAFLFINQRMRYIEQKAFPKAFKDKYVLEDTQLGRGATGVVRRGRDKVTNKKVAVKVINKRYQKNTKDIAYEGNLLKQLSHQHIVAIKDLFETESFVYIVLECLESGDLFDYIRQNGAIPEERCVELFKQLLEAVHYLHVNDIIHRDLKPENILLSSKDLEHTVLKITDFGLSRFVSTNSWLSTMVGTSLYLAPEVLQRKKYTFAADLWSLGCILFMMLSASLPFELRHEHSNPCQDIVDGNYNFDHPLWQKMSDEAKDLVRKLLTIDPHKRISARDALSHKWFLIKTKTW